MKTKGMNATKIAALIAELHAARPSATDVETMSAQELYEVASVVCSVGRQLWTMAKEGGAVAGPRGKRRDSKAAPAEPVSQDAVTDEEKEDQAAEDQEIADAEAMKEESRVIRLGEEMQRPMFDVMTMGDLVSWFNMHAERNTPFALKTVERFSTRVVAIKRCVALFENIAAK